MSEYNEIAEAESSGLEIVSAILHIIDGKRKTSVYSEMTLDLEEPMTEKYVKRYIQRCRRDVRTKPGTYKEDSRFKEYADRYFHGQSSLPAFSSAVLEPLQDHLFNEVFASCACLFADYRYDDIPYLAVILLEEQECAAYFTDVMSGGVVNRIRFGVPSLPAPSRPLSAFALVNLLSGDISIVDTEKHKEGQAWIADILLQAETGISGKEVVDTVQEIAVTVAEEHGEDPTAVLGRVRNYLRETVSEGMPLHTETMAQEIFEEKPEIAEAFVQKARQQTLPEKTELPKAVIRPSMKKQKIATDTGVEITFPAEYFQDDQYIEFHKHPDGTTTIEIKHIGHITNKL